MKNLHQTSPYYQRERRYPFLVAIDLMVHFALSLAAIALTAVALRMSLEIVLPVLGQFLRH